jgi:Flp pilus assembly protein TadD
LKRFEEAEATFREAMKLTPASWANYSYLGRFLIDRHRYSEAEEVYLKALEIAPDNARLWSNLGAAYYYQGRYEDAEGAWQKSVNLHPTAAAVSNLGTRQFYEGRYAEAARTYEKAVEINRRDYRVWANLAAAYYWTPGERYRVGEACARLGELVALELGVGARNASAVMANAECHSMIGSVRDARAMVEEALSFGSGDVDIVKAAAVVYEGIGDREAALHWIGKALSAGYSLDEIERDPSLANLRADPRYPPLTRKQRAEGNVR